MRAQDDHLDSGGCLESIYRIGAGQCNEGEQHENSLRSKDMSNEDSQIVSIKRCIIKD